MSVPVRLAGAGRYGDSTVTWTVSEGRRGRRWREVLTRDGAVVHALLIETDPAGRFAHLEFAAAGVLVTLHPEGDGTLHGNHVDAAGTRVEHVEGLPFPDGSVVFVEGSPIGAAAVIWGGRATVGDGSGSPVGGAMVDARGRVSMADAATLADRLIATGIETDDLGIPVLESGTSWPLER